MIGSSPGESALDVAEELGFEQLFRNGAAVDRREGALAPGTHPVDGPGNDLLAGAGFAGDQNRGVMPGHPRCQLQDLAHGRALGHDQLLDRADPHVRAQGLDFAAEALPLLGLPHRHDDVIGLERLLDIVIRTLPDGGECSFLGTLPAQHDHDRVPALGAEPPEEAQPVHSRQRDPAEDQLEVLSRCTHQRARSLRLGLDYVAGLSEQQRERLPDIGVVLNNKQPHQFTRVW